MHQSSRARRGTSKDVKATLADQRAATSTFRLFVRSRIISVAFVYGCSADKLCRGSILVVSSFSQTVRIWVCEVIIAAVRVWMSVDV